MKKPNPVKQNLDLLIAYMNNVIHEEQEAEIQDVIENKKGKNSSGK